MINIEEKISMVKKGFNPFKVKYVNSDGEDLYTKSQLNVLFFEYGEYCSYIQSNGYDTINFFLNATNFIKYELYLAIGEKHGAWYYSFKDVLKMCELYPLEDYKKIRILNNIDTIKLLKQNKKPISTQTLVQQPKKNNERVFLYYFMKDYGRFPNEEEEAEYQKSFTEKEVEKMVEVYQKSLKKTKRS